MAALSGSWPTIAWISSFKRIPEKMRLKTNKVNQLVRLGSRHVNKFGELSALGLADFKKSEDGFMDAVIADS